MNAHGGPAAQTRKAVHTGSRSWTVWGLRASVVVTDLGQAEQAQNIVQEVLAGVDLACSRFRADSELAVNRAAFAEGYEASDILATLIDAALRAAVLSDGAVDPTLGNRLVSLGYTVELGSGESFPTNREDRAVTEHLSAMIRESIMPHLIPEPVVSPAEDAAKLPGWLRISLEGHRLLIPGDLAIDLGATAKAVAADLAAARIFAELGCGVLVNLGGDIATAGPAPEDGHWQILVQDTSADPAQQISLPAGHAIATSSTMKRRWEQDGAQRHHILDPSSGFPAEAIWRSVSVAAPSAWEANTFSTAAIVKGFKAKDWFVARGVAARLVDQQLNVVLTGGWPAEAESQRGGESND